MDNELQNKIDEPVKVETDWKTDTKQTDKPWLFKPGESGNPEGRPKEISITAAVRRKLNDEVLLSNGEKKKYLELMVAKIFDMALVDGDVTLIREIWRYVDGMPSQPLKFTNPLTVNEIPFTEGQFREILDAYLNSRTHERLANVPAPILISKQGRIEENLSGEDRPV